MIIGSRLRGVQRSLSALMQLTGDAGKCQRVVDIFRRYDATGTGVLEVHQLGRLLKSQVFGCTDADVKVALELWGRSGDNAVDYVSFITWAMRVDPGAIKSMSTLSPQAATR